VYILQFLTDRNSACVEDAWISAAKTMSRSPAQHQTIGCDAMDSWPNSDREL